MKEKNSCWHVGCMNTGFHVATFFGHRKIHYCSRHMSYWNKVRQNIIKSRRGETPKWTKEFKTDVAVVKD